MAKKKIIKTDGLGPHEKKKLRSAIRQVWHRSHARKLCVIRATDKQGYPFCEQCKRRAPKIQIDHIFMVGELDDGFISRMFVASKFLIGLCKKCHGLKTKKDKKRLDDKKGFL